MNKYNNNNFSRVPACESTIRFNKRPRLGANNGGGITSSPRFKNQNHSGYQFSQSRNNVADCYQSNQYEIGSNTHLYGITQKRPNNTRQHQTKQLSPYSRKPTISSSFSPSSSSSFSVSTQNGLNLPHPQPKSSTVQEPSATITTQSNQQHEQQITTNIMDNSNYYRFGYNNFYSTFNAELIASASSPVFGVADGMNPIMWQTITSTPPPKLPQQHQPPLPQHQPLPIPPPLPSSDNLSLPPPPPPIPPPAIDSPSTMTQAKTDQKNKSSDQDSATKTIVKIKTKRKAMSMRYKLSKSWSEKDALLALKAEETNARKLQKDIILIIRFPDPEISREIVKSYSPDIESVHFQLNFAPRYCLVHLKPGTNVEKTIDNLSKIPFGTGFLSVEIKQIPHKAHSTKLNEIDPFTLYVGNLPTTIACKTLKEHFPGAARIDIGFAQRMKYTRYAFIRYQNVQQAIEAYKRMLDAEIGGRTLTIRFRRLAVASESNKDGESENHDDIHDDPLTQIAAPSDENLITSIQIGTENVNPVNSLEDKNNTDIVRRNSNDLSIETEKHTTEMNKIADNNSVQKGISKVNNLSEIVNSKAEMDSLETGTSAVQAEKSSTLILNIKPEPDIDPDDIVIRSDAFVNRIEDTNSNIKQEEENLALYNEFFENPSNQNQNDSCEKSIRSDAFSLDSTIDETDTMSTLSTNSLGEFLQTCQMHQTQENNEYLGPSPTKKNKVTNDILQVSIKRQPLENNSNENRLYMPLFPKESVSQDTVKQEPDEYNKERNHENSSAQIIKSQTNETISWNKEKVTSTTRSKDFYNNTTNDDVVPSNALFFRSAYQNMLTSSSNVSDYDEFYETRINVSQKPTSLANIKTEPPDISEIRSKVKNNKSVQQNDTINRNGIMLSKEKSNINSTQTFNNSEDDDSVPSQNLLGSYQPLQNIIKQEKEHDDIFLVPFHKNCVNDDTSLDDICNNIDPTTNCKVLANNLENTCEVAKTNNIPEDHDEDVVIISDNIKRQSKETNSKNFVSTNLFLPTQTDLISFKHKPKPKSVTIPNRKVSPLVHQDYLDRLYDQLDADSDGEL